MNAKLHRIPTLNSLSIPDGLQQFDRQTLAKRLSDEGTSAKRVAQKARRERTAGPCLLLPSRPLLHLLWLY